VTLLPRWITEMLRFLGFLWAFGSIILLMLFGTISSPLTDAKQLQAVIVNIGIGTISALIAIAARPDPTVERTQADSAQKSTEAK